jgi:hypothetical protein
MSRTSVMRSSQPTVNSRPLHEAIHDWRSLVRVLILTPGVFDKGGISRYVRYQARALAESPRISEVETFALSDGELTTSKSHSTPRGQDRPRSTVRLVCSSSGK